MRNLGDLRDERLQRYSVGIQHCDLEEENCREGNSGQLIMCGVCYQRGFRTKLTFQMSTEQGDAQVYLQASECSVFSLKGKPSLLWSQLQSAGPPQTRAAYLIPLTSSKGDAHCPQLGVSEFHLQETGQHTAVMGIVFGVDILPLQIPALEVVEDIAHGRYCFRVHLSVQRCELF